jgi:CubicO group peptidase (beta-lactamase class C family)
MRLDEYSQKNIFEPLGMKDTMFTPPPETHSRIAPTEWTTSDTSGSVEFTRTMIRGRVHDGNAFVQDGVSGHAGMFSTAEDMATFFKMMLRGGSTMDGNRILSPVTINSMTQDHTQLGDNAPGRGLGWDLTSSYSSQKGDLFTSGYGHTGFTGTSVWVVPEEKLAIIILSNRVHPYGKGDVTPLRARIANIIAGSITTSYRNETSENMK